MTEHAQMNAEVSAVFSQYPVSIRKKLMSLRRLILNVAANTDGVGKLEETLKWGEPAYVTAESGSGSTIRINRHKSAQGQYAMYFHCQTTLIETFRTLFPGALKFEGNRSIVFAETDKVPVRELTICITLALTYHLAKKSARTATSRHPSVAKGSIRSRARMRASG